MTHTKDFPKYKKYKIGDYTYGEPIVIERWGGDLQIGRFCSISPEAVIMLGGNHRSDWITTYPFMSFYKEFNDINGCPEASDKTAIGNDVWIAKDALILPGVSIGDGAVIGARTVVSKNVEPYCIFVGNPGRVAKKRFNDDVIAKLLEIRWWDWDMNRIKENVRLLCSDNMDAFIKKNYIPKNK